MKNFLKNNFFGMLALIVVLTIAATPPNSIIRLDTVMQRSAIVGSTSLRRADTSAWLQVGVADSSNRAALLIWWTDTTKVRGKKNGLIIYNKLDSSLWYHNGRLWKKV